MSHLTRPRVAQGALLLVVIAMFLPWATGAVWLVASGRDGDTVRGVQFGEGQLVLLVAVVTIVLIYKQVRPAWIGAGLLVAITGRALFDVTDVSSTDPGLGLWLGFVGAAAAAVILIGDLIAGIQQTAREVREQGS